MTALIIERLPYVSPSSAEILRLCFLRLLFARQSHGTHQARGPYSRLGTIVHQVLAAAANRLFELSDNAAFDQFWQELVDAEELAMASGPDAHFGPLRHWRGYELVRARTRVAARSLASTTSDQQFIEQEFQSNDGRIRGRPDRVTVRDGIVAVEDYKTGVIYESSEDTSAPALKSIYRRQLLIYAYLVHDSLHLWPSTGNVLALSGEQESLSLSKDDAEMVADESVHLLDAYNDAITSTADLESLASPHPAACAGCDYQTKCDPHWKSASPDWTSYVSLEGTVLKVQTAGNGFTALLVDVDRGTVPAGQLIVGQLDRQRFLQLTSVVEGTRLRLVKLRRQQRSMAPGPFTELCLVQ